MDKGKDKVDNASEPLTTQKFTHNKTISAKTIPGTSCKVFAGKAPKPIRKSHTYINAITREMNIHVPTIKARHAGTFHYRRTATIRRQRPGGILLTFTYSSHFTNTFTI